MKVTCQQICILTSKKKNQKLIMNLLFLKTNPQLYIVGIFLNQCLTQNPTPTKDPSRDFFFSSSSLLLYFQNPHLPRHGSRHIICWMETTRFHYSHIFSHQKMFITRSLHYHPRRWGGRNAASPCYSMYFRYTFFVKSQHS